MTMTSTYSFGFQSRERPRQGVVVADVGGHVDAVEHQVGHAEHVREVLLLDAGEAVLQDGHVLVGLGLIAEVVDGAGEEAAGAAGGVEDGLAEAWDRPARR